MRTESITLEQFIREQQLEMSVVRVKRNPYMTDMPRNFECTIEQRGFGSKDPMTVYFSQGLGHTKMPTLADVLGCLASDAGGFDNAESFENWCSEYGYDTDSRKAERTYEVIKQQAEELKRLLDTEAYEQLLYNVERL